MNKYIPLAFIACVSCAQPGEFYNVAIDPLFTIDERQSVISALHDWETKTKHILYFNYYIANCSGVHNKFICIHKATIEQLDSSFNKYDPKDQSEDKDILGYTHSKRGLCEPGVSGGIDGIDGGEIWMSVDKIADFAFKCADPLRAVAAHEVGHAMGLIHIKNVQCIMYPVIFATDEVSFSCDINQWAEIRDVAPDQIGELY